MNKKAQTVGILLIVAVAVIVGLILFQAIAGNTDIPTKTATLSNGQYTMPANGACKDLIGQELLSTPVVTNRTSGTDFSGINHTIAEGISSVDGLKRIRICSTGSSILGSPISGLAVNISYTYGREGYIEDSAGRSIAGLIVLLAAIGIALIALQGVRKNY